MATTLGRGGSRPEDYLKPKKTTTPTYTTQKTTTPTVTTTPAAPTRTPVMAYDKTGQAISGAYIENGQTYIGNGTRIAEGTKVIDDSGREWVKGSGASGGTLTGNDLGIGRGNTRDLTGTGLSDEYYDKYLTEQQAGIDARTNAAIEANNAYIPQVNTQSDKALQDAYILREQNKVNAPQALSALGYTGGASETALMGINTGYENSRNTIETNRTNSLNDIYENERQIRATGDATKAEAAADYYNKLIAAQEKAKAAQQAQDNWQAEYNLEAKQYEDAAAQQAWQNAYDERVLGMKQSSASSGSSGKSSGGATTDKNVSGNYNVVLNNVKRALGGSNAGGQAAWNAVINYIQNSQRQGMITEYEAQQMINQLGLN